MKNKDLSILLIVLIVAGVESAFASSNSVSQKISSFDGDILSIANACGALALTASAGLMYAGQVEYGKWLFKGSLGGLFLLVLVPHITKVIS